MPLASALEEVLPFVLAEQQAHLFAETLVLGQLGVDVDNLLGRLLGIAEERDVALVTQRRQSQVALALLPGAEQRALTPDAKVGLGQREAVGRGRNLGQSFVAVLPAEEVAPARVLAAADAASELMQLRDPEPVGALDDHDCRLGHVNTNLDDRGGDEDLDLARAEA